MATLRPLLIRVTGRRTATLPAVTGVLPLYSQEQIRPSVRVGSLMNGAVCHNQTFDRSIRMASQDIDHLTLCYAPLGARFEHAIDFVAECGQSGNFVIDGDQMRFGYGIDGRA